MSLLAFQTALGRFVRSPNVADALADLDLDERECAYFAALQQNAGFHFTRAVQRSWCVGRAASAARLTFSILPPIVRRVLLDEWIDAGGGTASFGAAESDALLEFIAERLPAPSHALSVCRLEQLTLRASDGARAFRVPDSRVLEAPACLVRRSRDAGIVTFYGEPHHIIAALKRAARPPLREPANYLFAPGLPGLYRAASAGEVALWSQLATPLQVASCPRAGHRRETLATLFLAGALEATT